MEHWSKDTERRQTKQKAEDNKRKRWAARFPQKSRV